ncbi:MAG: extracellular solute-binding protein [Clostridia bacterium]|nr:extracellular solute-binding protein [Clostridia bacterium]
MKKLLVSIMLVILMMTSSVLTACGGGEGGGDAAIDYSKTIVFYSTQGDKLQTETANAIASFEANNPGWKVEHIQPGGYDETKDKIVSDFQAASQPDLAYCYPDHVAQYLKTGKVVDLSKFINDAEVGFSAEDIADFVPGYYNEGYARNFAGYESAGLEADSMITLPFVKSTELMYVNMTALKAAGFDAPATTWDELWEQCEKIVKTFPKATPLGYDSEANWFITMCEQNGWGYTSASEPHYLFKNAQAQAWLEKLNEYYGKGYITTQKDYGAYTSALFTKGVEDGGLVYCIGSSGGASYQDPGNKFEWAIAPIPGSKLADGTVNYSVISQGPSLVMLKDGNGVVNSEEKQRMTWLFMKELLDPMFQAAFSIASGYNPCRISTFANEDYIAHIAKGNITAKAAGVAKELSERFYTSPAFVGSSTAREQVGTALYFALTGQKTAEQALADAYKNCGGK